MNLHALMPVRNDDWCFPFTARVALKWCDRLHLLLHACNANTQELADKLFTENPGKVTIFVEPDPTWNEMNHRQHLLETARRSGATHIALVDADEFLSANLIPNIRDYVQRTPRDSCLSLTKLDCWGGLTLYRNELPFNARLSLAFPDKPNYTWQPRRYGYQHHCRPPHPLTQGYCPQADGGIFHLQFARLNATRAKQAKYKMQELLRWPEFGAAHINRKYSWWNTPPRKLDLIPPAWLEPYSDLRRYLDLSDDKPTWHEEEIRKLIEKHGKGAFAGLDLFGVA